MHELTSADAPPFSAMNSDLITRNFSEDIRPKVSVAVACYNYGSFLPELLESLDQQTAKDFEIIIVDDGSTDDSLGTARRLCEMYRGRMFITLLHQENQGVSAARNKGLSIARGKYLMCLDPDDRIAPRYLEDVLEVFDSQDVDVVYPGLQASGELSYTFIPPDFNPDALKYWNYIPVCSVFKKRVFEGCGGFKSNVHSHEDWDFWLTAAAKGFSFMALRKPLFFYRVHGNSLTSRMRSEKKNIVARLRLNSRELYDAPDLDWARMVLDGEAAAPHTGKSALLITDHYPPAVGETVSFSECLAMELLKSGFAVEVATKYTEGRHSYYHNGVNLHDFEWSGSPLLDSRSASENKLDQFVEDGNYDLFIAVGDPLNRALWAAKSSHSSKCILVPFIDAQVYHLLQREKVLRERLNEHFRKTGLLLCVRKSGYEEAYLEENRLPSLHLPYPTPFVAPVMDLRREMNIDPGKKVVLSLSTFLNGHDPSLRKIQDDAPDCMLIRMSPLRQEISFLTGETNENGQKCIPLGSFGPSGTAAIMESADLLLIPERIDFVEAWIARAMSHKLPWIAAEGVLRTGGSEFSGGRVVPRDELAQAATELLLRPAQRQGMAEEGFQSWNRGHRMEPFLENVLKMVGICPDAPPSFSLVRNPVQPGREYLKYLRSGQKGRNLVSVVIPTYNRPHLLVQAVSSVLAQTYPDLEIVVVNDHGTDVQDQIRQFKDDRILYHQNESNLGLAACRNVGVRLSHGRYVSYLDDDDLYYPSHIETLVQALTGSGKEVAYTDSFQVVQKKFEGEWVRRDKYLRFSVDFNRDRLLARNIAPVNCFMHTRDCFFEAGGFDEDLSVLEDWDLWIRMAQRHTFLHVREITCEVRLRESRENMSFEREGRYREALLYINRKYDGMVMECRDRLDKHSIIKKAEILSEFETLRKSSDPDQAFDFLESKLKGEILSPYLEYVCAQAYLEIGDPSRASVHLQRCLELNPRDRDALNDLAVIEYERKNIGPAISFLERSLSIEPSHRDSRINLIDICTENGMLEKASEHLRTFVQSHPNDPEALIRLERMRGMKPEILAKP